MTSYRVHYKKGDIEVEVESSDKDYVEQMLQKLLSAQASQTPPAKLVKKSKTPQMGRRQK